MQPPGLTRMIHRGAAVFIVKVEPWGSAPDPASFRSAACLVVFFDLTAGFFPLFMMLPPLVFQSRFDWF